MPMDPKDQLKFMTTKTDVPGPKFPLTHEQAVNLIASQGIVPRYARAAVQQYGIPESVAGLGQLVELARRDYAAAGRKRLNEIFGLSDE